MSKKFSQPKSKVKNLPIPDVGRGGYPPAEYGKGGKKGKTITFLPKKK